MLTFKPVSLEDKPWIDEIVFAENSRSADFNFGNIYMWDPCYRQQIARVGDRLVVKLCYWPLSFFAFPIGSGDLRPAVLAMREHALEHGHHFLLEGVTKKHVAELEDAFPGRFLIEPERDYFDYVYSAESLATLSGKKLHAKRNHINRFEMQNDWHFDPLTPAHFPACMGLLEHWMLDYGEGAEDERAAILRGFESWDALGLEGGVLFAGGHLVAFTVGERIASDTFDIHFEKAYADVTGAYPMVNREFVRYLTGRHPEILYINREDDMGNENLRRAKQSYDPLFLVEKFTACWEEK
jgi:hypothetical protein